MSYSGLVCRGSQIRPTAPMAQIDIGRLRETLATRCLGGIGGDRNPNWSHRGLDCAIAAGRARDARLPSVDARESEALATYRDLME